MITVNDCGIIQAGETTGFFYLGSFVVGILSLKHRLDQYYIDMDPYREICTYLPGPQGPRPMDSILGVQADSFYFIIAQISIISRRCYLYFHHKLYPCCPPLPVQKFDLL